MNKISKSAISAVLKEQGLEFVKLSSGGSCYDSKCYTGFNGKRVKGIYAAQFGPMTVTSAYQDHIRNKLADVEGALLKLGMEYLHEGVMVANKDAKRPLKLSLRTEYFPAYMRSANLDDGYKNIFIVPEYS